MLPPDGNMTFHTLGIHTLIFPTISNSLRETCCNHVITDQLEMIKRQDP